MKLEVKFRLNLIALLLSVGAHASPVIGYGSSNAVAPSRAQEMFLMGFEAGFNRATKSVRLRELLSVDQSTDGSQLGAIGSARRLIGRGVVALAGFPSSHEALLAGQIAKRENMLMLSAGAGHSRMAQLGDTVYTTGESAIDSAKAVLGLVERQFKNQVGVVISNPYATFSVDQEALLREQLRRRRGLNKIEFLHLNAELTLDDADLKALSRKSVKFMILTAYADDMPRFLSQLDNAHVDLPIITNNWTASDVDLIRRSLTKRRAPVFALTVWDERSVDYRRFKKIITDTYGKDPTPEMAAGFDIGAVLGQTLSQVHGPVTAQAMLKQFHARRCFPGTSTGKLCFGRNGGFALRKIHVVRFTKHGLVPVQ